jgi:hypothetical protein
VAHEVKTAYQMGWSALTNGRLLRQASTSFSAFVTVDQNIQFQQNLSSLPIAAAILVASDNRYETLTPFAPAVLKWLAGPLELRLVRIEADGRIVPL